MPQIAIAFFVSMFGVNTTSYVTRNLQESSFTEVILAIVDRIIPWKKREKI